MSVHHPILVYTLFALLPSPGSAQAADTTRSMDDAVEEAWDFWERGDTALAVTLLRRAVDSDPGDPDAVFALGTVLARSAPLAERDFRQRAEAEELLDRAYRLRDGDPQVLIELGLLKRKQNFRVDARRILEGAIHDIPDEDIDPLRAADAFYGLARLLEEDLYDFEHLVFLGPAFRQFGDPGADPQGGTAASAFCPAGVSFFCYNYTRSRDFNLLFEEVATPASDRPAELYPLLEDHYRTALSYNPRHEMAARGLMALYLRQDRSEALGAVADELVRLDPGQAFPWLFRGLAHYAAEDWAEARRYFDEGLRRLAPDERVAYEDVSLLLQRAQRARYASLGDVDKREYEEVLWARSDPLYLVPGNERRLDHVARVTYAELNFGNPERGQSGYESDRGLVYIRWGPPRKIWKIDTGTRLAQGNGGRVILWNYRIDAPSFIFFSQAGYQTVRFDQSANTAAYASELAETESASVFRSRAVTTWIDLPHQIARLKGSQPNVTRVMAYADVSPSRFLLFDGDSVQAALFLFSPQMRDTVEMRQTLSSEASGQLAFTVEVYPASYEFALEGFANESRVAGTERGGLTILGYPEDSLSVSDLIVADGVLPRTPEPVRWSDFSIAASRDLAYSPDDEIHLYFEMYGLRPSDEGMAQYRLELTVQDVTEAGLVSSVVRSLGGLIGLGDNDETRVRFDRTREIREGIVPEYLSISLPEVDPGTYEIQIQVEDRESGMVRSLARVVTILDR